ncbi:hypothetical protein [Sicyoidochytrium minutum DNA virus]|nr:hypothetical protein [Sicyoidochytrium minutum DNA virus]
MEENWRLSRPEDKSHKAWVVFGKNKDRRKGFFQRQSWNPTPTFDERVLKADTGGFAIDKTGAMDKFAMFKHQIETDTEPGKFEEDETLKRVREKLEFSRQRAEQRFRIKIPIETEEVERHLFMGRKYMCSITGTHLTLECFDEHHHVTYQVSDDRARINIICSECERVA